MQTLVEDFLQYLRHERGQSDNTARTYAALLGKFTAWAAKQKLTDWKQVELKHLMAFLQHERERPLADEPESSAKRLSSESVYLEIAALRAFYKFAENEKLLPVNAAENLSLPRHWKRLPKALSNDEIERLLKPESPKTKETLRDQAILELAYASGLRLSELKNLRLEQLHLEAGFVNVIGKGNKERVVPAGRKAVEALNRYLQVARPKFITPKSPANVFLTKRGAPFAAVTLWLRIKNRIRRAGIERNVTWNLIHKYVGGKPAGLTTREMIDWMLSPEWDTVKYPAFYKATAAKVLARSFSFRLTEANDFTAGVGHGGIPGGNNSFATALFALDFLHWWAARACAGVSVHTGLSNLNEAVYRDASGNWQIFPYAYGIKAFDLGSHGQVEPITIVNPDGLNLTAYAVGDPTNLHVTVINKQHGAGAKDANMTLLPRNFSSRSAAAMFLTCSERKY